MLKLFRKITKKRIVVLAPTGIAALNAMGQTIHSFFRFPFGVITSATISYQSRLSSLLEYVDMIIIDEVSMLRADMMDGIETSLRIHKNNDKLFGGVQMVFFGDLYQLPPVVTNRDQAQYLTSTYGGFFFFNADAVSRMNLIYRELTLIFRQKNDDDFKEILNRFRENELTAKDFQKINAQSINNNNIDLGGTLSVMLCPTNSAARIANEQQLAKIEEREYVYNAKLTGDFFKTKSRYGYKELIVEPTLRLKVGAQIMMLKNDPEKRWVNGTLGRVHALADNWIEVDIDGIIYSVDKEKWVSKKYVYSKSKQTIEEEVAGECIQYPIGLAWAITIHPTFPEKHNE